MRNQALKMNAGSLITKKLFEEHNQMRSLVQSIKPLLQAICERQATNELKKAQELMRQLIQTLNRHANCEDIVIFPILSKYHPVLALEAEHNELLIKRSALLLETTNYTFPDDCSNKLYSHANIFFDLLEKHMKEEEETIFPAIEKFLSSEEQWHLCTRMEKIQSSSLKNKNLPSIGLKLFNFPISDFNIKKGKTFLEKESPQIKSLTLKLNEAIDKEEPLNRIVLFLYSGKAKWSTPHASVVIRAGEGISIDPQMIFSIEAETNCRFLLFALHPELTAKAETYDNIAVFPGD